MNDIIYLDHEVAVRVAMHLGFAKSQLFQDDGEFVAFKILQHLLNEYGLIHQPWVGNFKVTDSKKITAFILKYG